MNIDEKTEEQKYGLLSLIRNRIITGLLLLIPTAITLWIVIYALNLLTGWSVEILDSIPSLHPYMQSAWLNLATRIAAFIFLIVILFLIGQLAKYTFARNMMSYLESLVMQIPMFSSIYSTIKQIIDTFKTAQSGMFREVVLIEYPRKGIYAIGFLTNRNFDTWEPNQKTGKKLLSVFLPTTPNPTSGFLLFVPEEECMILDMDVSDGMKLVISGGVLISKPRYNNLQNNFNRELQ